MSLRRFSRPSLSDFFRSRRAAALSAATAAVAAASLPRALFRRGADESTRWRRVGAEIHDQARTVTGVGKANRAAERMSAAEVILNNIVLKEGICHYLPTVMVMGDVWGDYCTGWSGHK